MEPVDTSLSFSPGVTKIMMIGLQGAGKTTQRASWPADFRTRQKPMLVATDIYRPAAVEQLKILGQRLDVGYFEEGAQPPDICDRALLVKRAQAGM